MAKIMEDRLICARDQYFKDRPQLDRTIEREEIFEAGFRMAFKDFPYLLRLIESNITDMPPEFSKAVDENFWDLVS